MPGQQDAAPASSDTGPAGRGQHTSLLPQLKMCEFTLPFSNKFGGHNFFLLFKPAGIQF